MISATPTHYRAYNGQGPPTSEHFSQLKTANSVRNGAPKKAEEPYLCPFVSRNAQASANQGCSTASQGSCHVLKPTHLPLSHLFCYRKTYLQNGLRQLITCGQSCMTSTLVISG